MLTMNDQQNPRITKLRPVLFVSDLALSLAFWRERLGFEAIYQLTNGGAFEFVVLHKDGVEIVLRRRDAGREAGVGRESNPVEASAVVYLEVDSLAKALARIGGVEVVLPQRRTSYGAVETAVREPGGHIVCFSQIEKHASRDGP
jgi:catechol 2,3-dioxygenase-like lactoylglutathione lyase family enzyme